jgi:hypothetical protein
MNRLEGIKHNWEKLQAINPGDMAALGEDTNS